MEPHEIAEAQALVNRWGKYFLRNGHNGHPYLKDLMSVVVYAQYLEELVETQKPLPHTRPGWWSRFKESLGLPQ